MPDLTRYNLSKFFFRLAFVLCGVLGTQAHEFIQQHPTISLMLAAAAAYAHGFFTDNGTDKK
jgi:hypothetical protein